MTELTSRRVVRELLDRFGLAADKGFGQNFLVDSAALAAIVAAAEIDPGDTVLEIGPGLGTLTRALAERAGRVVAIEADRRLIEPLRFTLAEHDNIELLREDALDFDLTELPLGSLLVANLPYNIGTAVLIRALEAGVFARMVLLLQREVAERLVARPGQAAFGSLSLFAQHHARVRIVRRLAAGSFEPPPRVRSAVVRLDVDSRARTEPSLFAFVRLGFAHRRKTLANNLELAGFERDGVVAALVALGIDPRVRAERLDLDTFRSLHARLQRGHDQDA